MAIEMVGWELSRYDAVLDAEDIARLRALGTPLGEFAIACNSTAQAAYLQQTGEHGISLPDPIAMSILLRPELCLRSSDHYVEIETVSELTRGMTVVDRLGVSGDGRNENGWEECRARQKKVKVYWELDVIEWKKLLTESLTWRTEQRILEV